MKMKNGADKTCAISWPKFRSEKGFSTASTFSLRCRRSPKGGGNRQAQLAGGPLEAPVSARRRQPIANCGGERGATGEHGVLVLRREVLQRRQPITWDAQRTCSRKDRGTRLLECERIGHRLRLEQERCPPQRRDKELPGRTCNEGRNTAARTRPVQETALLQSVPESLFRVEEGLTRARWLRLRATEEALGAWS
jgi:hypothetical protein